MKTKGGFIIENFKKLEIPIEHGILEPHIYEGLVKNIPTYDNKKEDFIITWDKFGKCLNLLREDCFIEIPI